MKKTICSCRACFDVLHLALHSIAIIFWFDSNYTLHEFLSFKTNTNLDIKLYSSIPNLI